MLLDKLNWVHHDGTIYSIHAQPNGARFATGGIDQTVKIWNLAAALDATLEAQQNTPKLLATLVEHNGPVNVVRFSGDSNLLASGSDDAAVIIYELRPGAGGTMLGSSTANVENWRPRVALRGHATNIGDLAWSADNSRLATASMDGNVMVWDVATGHRLATLQAHNNFVKGVQWDPVGSYLVSQSDDRSVVVYRTSDWAELARIDKPYRKMITSTFATRLSFSPDGQFLLTGNSYQSGNHVAVIVQRGQWEDAAQLLFLVGHEGAVVSTAFNPRMFHLPEPKAKPDGPANGKENMTFSDALTNVFATGGQDKRVVVWTAGQERPVFAGKAFFKSQVTDLSWTSDGYTLLACSADGTVGVFQFNESELGRASSSEELAEVMRTVYGNRQRVAGGGLLFAESIDQLPPEEEEQQQQQQQQQPQAAMQQRPLLKPLEAQQPAAQRRQEAAPAPAKPSNEMDALTARLEGRMGPGGGGGGETQVGFGPSQPGGAAAAAAARPAEAPVRGKDGRKRIVPEATAGTAALGSAMPPPAPRPPAAAAAAPAAPAAKRQRAAGAAGGAAAGSNHLAAAPGPSGQTAAAHAPAAAAMQQHGAVASGWGGMQLLQPPAVKQEWTVRFREQPPAGAAEGEGGGAAPPQPRQLRIVNRERGIGGRPQVELSCMQGTDVVWTDAAAGVAVCACGTSNFAAVGLQDGSVLLYSPAGRRRGGPFKLGAGLARLACDSGWLLLAITTSGRVKLLHVGQQQSLLSTSVAPLVEDGAQVVDARLSRQGWPMLTLSSHKAYLWHPGVEEWMCAAEEAYAASPFMPTMRLQNQGELTGLQAQVVAGSAACQPRALLSAKPAQHQQSRALLESNLAAALCLRSPQEYRRWLGAYAQLLTEMGDEGRLRELCMDLMGPPFGTPAAAAAAAQPAEPSTGPAAAAAAAGDVGGRGDGDTLMADTSGAVLAASSGQQHPTGPGAGGVGSGEPGGSGGWQPRLLGLDKRQDLLVGEVLRVVSRSRVLGGLAGEVRDLLEDVCRLEGSG